MTALELAARALFWMDDGVRYAADDKRTWAEADDLLREKYMKEARAVLDALQVQGDAMASARANQLALQRGHSLTRFDLSDAWSVMIDAALEEG